MTRFNPNPDPHPHSHPNPNPDPDPDSGPNPNQAQRAPPNKYKQTYLEGGGKGALRISTVTEGDPVIVGEIFVHRKVS